MLVSSVQFMTQTVMPDSLRPYGYSTPGFPDHHQASLTITSSWSLLKLMSIESVMPSSHLILCRPLLLLPQSLPYYLQAVSSSVRSSHSVVSNSLWPHGLQHARPHCPSPSPGVYPNSCSLSWWCHPTVSSSVIPFSSHLQTFPASGSFLRSQFFASGGQSIRVSASASVLPMNIQDWSPLGWTGWISLQSKGPARIFSNITIQKHQFLGTQLSL